MAIFESLANTLKRLAVGDRVKVTLRPESGQWPNPLDGEIAQKDDSGKLFVRAAHGLVEVEAADILSITNLSR